MIADRYAADDSGTRADPDVGADLNRGDRDSEASIGDPRGMTGRQQADVWADHGVFADLDAAHVVESAAVVDEHVGSNLELEAVVTMDRRYQLKTLIDGPAGQL